MVPPRIYALVAARAPVALVFARGPASWWALRRWDLATGALGAAAWFHGTLYPRRCDLSPDGRYLYYFALAPVRGEWLGQRGVWADWDPAGRLLVATSDGRIAIRRVHDDGTEVEREHDLGGARPDPRPPPPEAAQY